jgi:lysophospholipase L1-like esterase
MSRIGTSWLILVLAVGAVGCQSAGTSDGAGSGGSGARGTPSGSGGGASDIGGSGAGGISPGSGGRIGTGGGAGGNGSTGAGGAPGAGGHIVLDAGLDVHGVDSSAARDASPDVDQSKLPDVKLYLAGDSTVMDYGTASAQEGWGQELGQFLITKVTIVNEAIGGRSIQSFMYDDAANTMPSSRWTSIQTNIRSGDFFMVQFGTNDSSGIAGRAVTPTDFQTLLGTMIDAIKTKGATPILVTPSALQEWTGGREGNTRLGPYAAAMRTIAPLKNVLVDDLNARSIELLDMVGQTAAMQIYINGDKAHFTKTGATDMAQIVAQELRRVGSPLAAYLK